MDIVIIGAGIGGLAAAVALTSQGHMVRLYEKASKIAEVGAGIQVTPNASQQLLKWSLEKHLPDLQHRTPCFKVRRWCDGALIGRMGTEHHTDKFGGPYVQVHRADLQQALLKLAQERGAQVNTQSAVTDIDMNKPAILLESGDWIQSDLVIAADGVRSIGRQKLCGVQSLETIPAGLAVVRATLPVDQVSSHRALSHLVSEPGINIWLGPKRHAIAYAMRGESLVNLVFEYPECRDLSRWDRVPYQSEVKAAFQGWNSNLQDLVEMMTSDSKSFLRYSNTADRWCSESGKVVLVGDASHTLPSFLAQGAAMAIEDAALLAQSLHGLSSGHSLKDRLKSFERHRKARKLEVQRLSLRQLRLFDLEDGEAQCHRDSDTCSDPELIPIWRNEQGQEWLYGYRLGPNGSVMDRDLAA